MKSLSFLFSIIVCCLFVLSCGNSADSSSDTESNTSTNTQEQAPTSNPTIVIPPGTKHYTCANNCEGSGGDTAGNCPVCGNPYVHNAAFHGNTNNSSIQIPPDVTISKDDFNKPPPVQTTPAAEKNAAGQFHYVCTKAGCAGGGGAAGNCGTCGSALAHNAGYHQ